MTDFPLPPDVQKTIDEALGKQAATGPQPTGFNGPQGNTYDSGVGRVPAAQVPNRPAGDEDVGEAPDIHPVDKMASAFIDHLVSKDQPAAPAGGTGSFRDKLGGALSAAAAGLGDAAAANNGGRGGWLGGVARTLNARNERLDKEKQQQFENQERLKNDQINYAHAQMQTLIGEQTLRHADSDDKRKALEYDKAIAGDLDTVGTPKLHSGMTSDQLQAWYADSQNSDVKGQVTAVKDGLTPTFDQHGNEFLRPTYTLYGAVPQAVKLNKSTAELLTNHGTDGKVYEAGSTFPGSTYVRAVKEAKAAQAADLVTQKVIQENRKNMSEADKAAEDTKEKQERNAAGLRLSLAIAASGGKPLDMLDYAERMTATAKTPEQKQQAAQFASDVTTYYTPTVIAAERAKAAELAQKRLEEANNRKDKALDRTEQVGTQKLLKDSDKFSDVSRERDTILANVSAAKNGDQLATSMAPLFSALGVTTSAGVHRINQTEVEAAGPRVGSLYRRWNVLMDKASSGTLPPESLQEASDLAQRLQGAAYIKYRNDVLLNANNNHLSDDKMMYDKNGHDFISIGDARKQHEVDYRTEYAEAGKIPPSAVKTGNKGAVYSMNGRDWFNSKDGSPFVQPAQPKTQGAQ
ncbi:Uncharacterised protein [uncultured archaeon]|nr:Uncharacterised protein [uncultured archaeon]